VHLAQAAEDGGEDANWSIRIALGSKYFLGISTNISLSFLPIKDRINAVFLLFKDKHLSDVFWG
jgi:hypothetical protein